MTELEIIQIVQTWLNNNFQKTKVSQLATASSLTGLYVLGFLANGSVKAPIELLKGNAGKSVELRNNNGELQWRVEGGTWAKLYDQDDLRGKPFAYEDFTQEQLDLLAESVGDGLEFRANATHIQYRLKGGTWIDVVSLELLKGDKGDKGDIGDTGLTGPKGDKGDPNTLSIGTVQGGASAEASITGTAPNQTLNLTLPKGDTGTKGDKGDKGDVGPANTLSIGTVKSGETSGASITGEAPNQTLNLTLEKGDTGNSGVYVGSEEPTDPNVKVWIDVTGSEDGNWIKEW